MQQFRAALAAPPPPEGELDKQAQALATQAASPPPTQTASLNTWNLIAAILIVIVFVSAGPRKGQSPVSKHWPQRGPLHEGDLLVTSPHSSREHDSELVLNTLSKSVGQGSL